MTQTAMNATGTSFNKRSNSVNSRKPVLNALAKQYQNQKMYLETKYIESGATILKQFPVPV